LAVIPAQRPDGSPATALPRTASFRRPAHPVAAKSRTHCELLTTWGDHRPKGTFMGSCQRSTKGSREEELRQQRAAGRALPRQARRRQTPRRIEAVEEEVRRRRLWRPVHSGSHCARAPRPRPLGVTTTRGVRRRPRAHRHRLARGLSSRMAVLPPAAWTPSSSPRYRLRRVRLPQLNRPLATGRGTRSATMSYESVAFREELGCRTRHCWSSR
jgi:hypothetical protein